MNFSFSSNECPKPKLFVSGLKDQYFVTWTRTSLYPFSVSRRVDKNKFSFIRTKYDLPFFLIQQPRCQMKLPQKNHCPAIFMNICITSAFNHLSVDICWVQYCLKIVHFNIFNNSFMVFLLLCYIMLCLSRLCKQKRIICCLNVNTNTGTRIIMSAYSHHLIQQICWIFSKISKYKG